MFYEKIKIIVINSLAVTIICNNYNILKFILNEATEKKPESNKNDDTILTSYTFDKYMFDVLYG